MPPTAISTPPFAPVSPRESRSNPPFPRLLTFEARFCSHHQCDAAAFRQFVFWQGIPGRLRPLARLLWLCRRSHFARDLRLIDEIAKARCVDDVQLDAHDFRQDPANRRFSRRVLRLRVSSGLIVSLARNYLPQRYGTLQPRAER